jgi:transposase InsO family protein
LATRIRQRRRIRCSGAVVKPAASQPNERSSMDFVTDCVSSGKVIRMLTIVDDCTRECPAIEVDTSLGGLRVRRLLDRIDSARGLPEAIVLERAGVSRASTGRLERRTRRATGVHPTGQAGAERLCGERPQAFVGCGRLRASPNDLAVVAGSLCHREGGRQYAGSSLIDLHPFLLHTRLRPAH